MSPQPSQHRHNASAPHAAARITIVEHGPYRVQGGVPLAQDAIAPCEDGTHLEYRRVKDYDVGAGDYHLCRCGRSHRAPFCDGTHVRTGFDGRETASRQSFEQRANRFDGDDAHLLDDGRCAFARLCHRKGGSVWSLTENGSSAEESAEAVRASWHCPTGRLVHIDGQTGAAYEQDFEPSILAMEDVQKGCSGPLFVRGGVRLVSADGSLYEQRNRYALCRCGLSRTMPFCDASHVSCGFSDGSAALKGVAGEVDRTFEADPPVAGA